MRFQCSASAAQVYKKSRSPLVIVETTKSERLVVLWQSYSSESHLCVARYASGCRCLFLSITIAKVMHINDIHK